MDWNNLQVLVTLSRTGSLSGAARALGVNHATISRRLAALENDVGTRLVRRLARSTPLTEKGQEVVGLAAEMEDRVRKIERLTNLRDGSVSGTVRLTAPPAFISETLMPKIASIVAVHSDLRMEFDADPKITSLEQGKADIAVRFSEPKGQQNVVRRLGDISYALYGIRDQVERQAEHWCFVGSGDIGAESSLDRWLLDFAATRPFVAKSSDFQVRMSAAKAGLGLALLPTILASSTTGLMRADTPSPPRQSAWLVIHPDVKNSSATRIVADAIVKVFSEARSETGHS